VTDAIALHAVSRLFGRTRALDEVDLRIPVGSICGLLGRNGAGKTSLMALVAGQDRPTTGRVEVLGQRPFENEAVLSKVSFVRDNQRYPDDYRLRHVLRIAPEFAPNWSADVASELADRLRIPSTTAITKFSRGQLSAVAILIGLASRAPVTLLDEPYLGLDVTARALFHDLLIRDYTEHPRTIVLSTHLVEESETLLDHVVIMDRGRILADCDSDQTRRLAFLLSGTTDAVGALADGPLLAGTEVLQSTTVGGLRSVTVRGVADEDIRSAAGAVGVQVSPASLQDLVVAFGADAPIPSTTHSTGVRA